MKKVIYFFLSVVPLLIYGVTVALFYFLFTFFIFRMGWFGDSWLFSDNNIDATLMLAVSITSAAISFLIYRYLKDKKRRSRPFRLTPATVLVLIALAFVCQYLTTLLISGISALIPQALDSYEELLESAGMSAPGLLLIFYTVIAGPIHEEILMRGATLSIAGRAFPFWAANLIQALLFGVFHMNLMQGCYAFCLGLVLGYLAHRYHSLVPSCFFHIIFNLLGMLVLTPDNVVAFFVSLALFSLLLMLALKLQKKRDPEQTLFPSSRDPFLDSL